MECDGGAHLDGKSPTDQCPAGGIGAAPVYDCGGSHVLSIVGLAGEWLVYGLFAGNVVVLALALALDGPLFIGYGCSGWELLCLD